MSTATSQARAVATPKPGTVDMKLEVIGLPVSDIDRAKAFYTGLGWRLDADFVISPGVRLLQMTPPGSPCSVHFGNGVTSAAPGSAQGLFLIVEDIDTARADLVERGIEVSETFHYAGIRGERLSGPDPERRSYASYASFSDPDGNGWLLQEITTRFPGRGLNLNAATLRELLREAETQHGVHGGAAPTHHWSDWYAGYLVARERGQAPDDASADATRQIARAAAAPTA